MKFLLCIGTIAVSCTLLAFADNWSKVKIVNLYVVKTNPEYITNYQWKVARVNDTYNRLGLIYDVVQDFPLNTNFVVELSRSDVGCKNYKKINDYAITLCTDKNHKYFDYLPDELITLYEEEKCLPQGHYESKDHTYFKFYNLLSDEELKNSCFQNNISFKSGNEVLHNIILEFVSNNNAN